MADVFITYIIGNKLLEFYFSSITLYPWRLIDFS